MVKIDATLWMPVPDWGLTEDSGYLMACLKSRFRSVLVTFYDPHADTITPPEADFDLLVQLFSIRNLKLVAAMKEIAQARGARMSNPAEATIVNCDKRTMPEIFGDCVPETHIIHNMAEAQASFDALGGDVVVKPPYFGKGEYVERISKPEDLGMIEEMFGITPSGDLVIQPFCTGFTEGDQRIILVREASGAGRIIANFARVPPEGGWLSNISAGGRLVSRAPRPEETRLALDVFERSGLDYVGLDIGWHDARALLIELNPTAGGVIDYDAAHQTSSIFALADMLERKLSEPLPWDDRLGLVEARPAARAAR